MEHKLKVMESYSFFFILFNSHPMGGLQSITGRWDKHQSLTPRVDLMCNFVFCSLLKKKSKQNTFHLLLSIYFRFPCLPTPTFTLSAPPRGRLQLWRTQKMHLFSRDFYQQTIVKGKGLWQANS